MKTFNFEKSKTKYVVLTVIMLLLFVLVYCLYCSNIKETFVNRNSNQIDVLLGKKKDGDLRKTLNDNTDKNNIKIMYSTYKTIQGLGYNDLFFLRYKPNNNNYKIIGDIVDIYDVQNNNNNINSINNDIIDSITTKDNIPQVLDPIINETKNAVVLTEKDKKDTIRIGDSNINNLLKIMNFNTDNYDFNKLYNYFNGHKSNNDYNKLSQNTKINTNKYIKYYKYDTLLRIIKFAQYNDVIKQYVINKGGEVNIEKNIINTIKTKLDDIKNDTTTTNINYIPAGYTLDTIPFNFYDNNGDKIDEYNKNDYLKYFLSIKSQYPPPSSDYDIIFTEFIFLENTNYEIKIEDYPILIYRTVSKPAISIQSNFVTSLFKRYGTEIDEIKNKYLSYLEELKDLISENNSLSIPLEITRFYNEDNEGKHIIFGDIISTESNQNTNNLENYLKIPKRCCKLYEEIPNYSELSPIYTLTSQNDETIKIYQHPIYKTFKTFKSNEDVDVPIYEIIPCAKQNTIYQDKIKKYQNIKDKCSKLHKTSQKVTIKDNTFDNLQIKTKIEDIHENEKIINQLKKQTNLLQKDISKKNIVNRAYNRSKLQNYNDQLYTDIYKGYKNLNNKSIGLNIKNTDQVIKHLIEKCKNNELSFCNNSNETQPSPSSPSSSSPPPSSPSSSPPPSSPSSSPPQNKKNYLLLLLTNLLKSKIPQTDKNNQLTRILHTCSS